jgi:rod shape determining protein RodA
MAVQPRIYSVTAPAEPRRRLGAGLSEALHNLDYVLLAAVAALVAYGLWTVQSVTVDDVPGDPGSFVRKQAIFVVLGLAAFVATTLIHPETLRRWRHALFGASLVLMVLVLLVGSDTRGSKRWIDLSFFQLQPSELGKICLIVFVAGFLAGRTKALESTSTVVGVVAIAALPILLVFVEPDFGTAMIYAFAILGALFFAGVRWQHLAALAVVTAVGALLVVWILPSAGVDVLKPYQVDRLVGFVHPDSDPTGTTYNVNQAITAVGSGGIDGRGVEGATQTQENFLPEHHTDFIFASLAEQRGFLGAALLLLLYAVVVWRGIRAVAAAESLFSATVAGAIVTAFLFQVFLNVGMNTGIAPITGITLPFVSYGGSSMIVSLAMVGMLQAVTIRGRANRRR